MNEFDSMYGEETTNTGPSTKTSNEFDSMYAPPDSSLLASSLREASMSNPDEEAKKRQMASQLGTAPSLLPHMSEAESELFLKLHPADTLQAKNPRTAKLLEDALFAKIAKDDIGTLTQIEQAITGITPKRVGGAVMSGLLQLNVGAFGVARAAADILPLPGAVSEYFTSKQKQAQLVSGHFAPDLTGAQSVERGLYSGVQSAAAQIPLMAASAPLALAGKLSSAANAMLATMSASTFGAEYGQAKDANLSTARATIHAAAQGGVEYLTEMLPAFALFKGLTGKTGLLKTASDFMTKDVLGEQVATAWQDFNTWVNINPEKTFDEYLKERPAAATETLVATFVGGAAQVGAAHAIGRVNRDTQSHAADAEANMATLKTIGKIVAESKVRERDPESFHAAMRQLSDDTNLQEIFVSAETLEKAFAKEGGNELLQKMPEVASQMAEALASNGDVRVSTADYATHIAGTPFDTSILPNIRTSPGSMTFKESEVFFQSQKEELAAEAEKLVANQEPVMTKEEFETAKAAEVVPERREVERRGVAENFAPTTSKEFGEAINHAEALRQEGADILAGKTRGPDRRAAGRRADTSTRDRLQAAKQSGAYSEEQVNNLLQIAREQPTAIREALGAARVKLAVSEPAEREAAQAEVTRLEAQLAEQGKVVEQALKETPAQKKAKAKTPKAGTYEAYLGTHPNQAAIQAADVQKVHDAILGEFKNSGRYNAAVSEINAIAMREAYANMAKRIGMKPSELYAKYPLQITKMAAGGFEQLNGLPETVLVDGKPMQFTEFKTASDVAKEYMAKAGLPYTPATQYAKVDKDRAKAIATEFENMKHDPENPEVKAAYDALIVETLAQWKAIEATGLKVEFITGEDPYGNPRNAIKDIVENNHFWVYPTSTGFGNEVTGDDTKDSLMLAVVPGVEISGRPVVANDVFRIVHDYFGHAKEGVGFRADGEENAWRIHRTMFSPLAQKALTTETRGQNSWVNFGPYGEKNRTAKPEDTVYAPQKNGLLPDWVVNEGAQDAVSVTGSRFSKQPRTELTGKFAGTGITGAEQKRLKFATDPRIKTRLNFYVDEGQGVFPEAGVGKNRADVPLNNLYDAKKNPLALPTADKNDFESAVIDAGFSGYYVKAGFHKQGVAVLLGKAAESVQVPKQEGTYAQSGTTSLAEVVTHINKKGRQPLDADTVEEAAGGATEFTLQEVPLSGIREDVKPADTRAVAMFAQLKTKAPAIVLGRAMNIVDGRHRVAAAKARGETSILAYVPVEGAVDNTDIGGWFNQSADDVSALGYFSALARGVENTDRKRGTADAWKAAIKKMENVTKEEIKTTGIFNFLDVLAAQGDKEISREAVLSYVNNNGLELEEVIREVGGVDKSAVRDKADELHDEWWEAVEYDYRNNFESGLDQNITEIEDEEGETTYAVSSDISSDSYDTEQAAQEAIDEAVSEEEDSAWAYSRDNMDTPDFEEQAREELGEDNPTDDAMSDDQLVDYDVFKGEGTNQRVIKLMLPNNPGKAFHGNHWAEGNIVATLRVSDGPDGQLLVPEVQADWAQEGRKEGFAGDPASAAEIEAAGWVADAAVVAHDRASDYYNSFGAKIRAVLGAPKGTDLVIAGQLIALDHKQLAKDFLDARKDRDEKNEARTAAVAAYRELETGGSGTPTAPFVQDTKAWTTLVLKRLLRYAAENGYKSIVFPTGQMQVDLYSGALQKRVDTIEWTKTDKGVQIIGYKGIQEVVNTTEKETALSDAIGKSMADKILSDPNQSGAIEGKDITISDTGMAGYYDRILPAVINKLSKSLGGGELVGQPLRGKSTAEYHKHTLRVIQPLTLNGRYGVFGAMGQEAMLAGPFDTAEEAYAVFPRVLEEQTAALRAKKDSVTLPTLEITPAMRDKIMLGLPLFQQQRGSFNPSTFTMSFLKSANLSTPVHESGHMYLELLAGISQQEDAPAEIVEDMGKVLNWFGVPDVAAWNAMTLDQKRPHHEQFAESFERYLFEGIAPSAELRPVFARFTAWLTNVYKSLQEFLKTHPAAGKLNDEIRSVFDRMLASQEAITQAEELAKYAPLFSSGKEARISEKDFIEYTKIGEQATADAVTEMQHESLKDMKWLSGAKSRALKELQSKANVARSAIRAQVAAEVSAEPVYQARATLRKKGSDLKLHTGVVKDMGHDTGPLLGMLSTENGTNPEQVAQIFGFSSGDALIKALVSAEDMNDKIDGMTDQRMLEEHGELIDERAVEQAANAAIHNEARAKFMATGLKILELKGKKDSGISATALAKAAKIAAETAMANKKVRDIRPAQYEAAESRSSKEALKLAAKKPEEAIIAQRAALLNNRLAKAAHESLDEVDKALAYLKKFEGEGVRKTIDLEYLEQVHAMLAPFNLRTSLTLKEIDQRKSLADWITKQEAAGFEPAIDQDQIELALRKSYKELTMDELRGLVDAVKQVEHIGRLKKKLLTAQDAREFAERVAEAQASILDNANRSPKERGTPADISGMVGQWVRQMAADHRKFASIIREMDGGHDNGVMFNLLLKSMNDAGNKETTMKAKAAEDMARIFKPVLSQIGADGRIVSHKKLIAGAEVSMTNEQRLMFALNWGNAGNRQRLLDGGITGYKSLSENQAKFILDTLTRSEWEFVQSVWDYLDTYRPMIAKQERALTGVEPNWVEPTPIVTSHGTFKGGYFPAKYDAMLSTRSESLEAATNLRQAMKGAFNSAATRKGYTQKRSDEVHGRPLLLSFNAISQHVSEVAHRLSWQEWLTDANRVVKALDGTVRETYGPEILKSLRDTIKDVAEGDAPAANAMESAINRVRVGSTIVGMGWRVSTALLQPSGLAQSWSRIGGKWLAKGVGHYLANPLKMGDMVNAKSEMMRSRGTTLMREVNEVLNVVRAGEKTSAIKASYFTLIAKMQRTVDMPTWLGAYEKALDTLRFEDQTTEELRTKVEKQAVALADQAVLDSQGGGQLKDLAGVQRGSPIFKLFTNFYSYFNTTYNLNVEAFRRTSFKSPSEIGMLASDLVLLNAVPVIFALALKELLKGNCEWEVECLAKRYGTEQANFMFGQMVLLREAGTAVSAATGDGFGYTGPAGLRFFADLYKLGEQAGQGDADLAAFKAANQVGGAILHYPAGQVNSTVEGIMAIENGDVEGFNVFSALIAGPKK